MTFAPVPEDDGTFLKCIGDNPKLISVAQEDSFKLNVVCKYDIHTNLKIKSIEICFCSRHSKLNNQEYEFCSSFTL